MFGNKVLRRYFGLRGTRLRGNGENYIMRSLMINIPHPILLGCSYVLCNAASYIIVILDNSLVFRVTIPDAVLIQFDLLRMSKILLETCTCKEL